MKLDEFICPHCRLEQPMKEGQPIHGKDGLIFTCNRCGEEVEFIA